MPNFTCHGCWGKGKGSYEKKPCENCKQPAGKKFKHNFHGHKKHNHIWQELDLYEKYM
jgi:hypothetical protein